MNTDEALTLLDTRTEDERATFPSKPQYEIAQAAGKVESIFMALFPLTHEAWCRAGRVAP